MNAKVAVIGLGKMGGSIATRLLSLEYVVAGYDPFPTAREAAAAQGVKVFDNPEEAIESASAIYTSLPNEQALLDLFGENSSLWNHVAPGTILIELSTISPEVMKGIASKAPKKALVVDAPISGGPKEAVAGTLGIFLGTDRKLTKSERSFLEAISIQIHEIGTIGSGKVLKIINNAISMTNTAIAAEAMSLGLRAGIDLETLYETLTLSGADSRQLRSRFPRAVAGDFKPGAAIRIVRKDLTLAQAFSKSVGGQTPIIDRANALFEVAEHAGLSEMDPVALINLLTSDEKSIKQEIEEL